MVPGGRTWSQVVAGGRWWSNGGAVDGGVALAYSSTMVAPRIALVTCQRLPDLDDDDRPVKRALEERGAVVTTPVWDGPRDAFGPDTVDLVTIRNPWDYTTRRDAFLSFVDDVAAHVPLLNDPSVLRDNTDKRYLHRLQQQGIATVPTAFVEQGSVVSADRFNAIVDQLPASTGWVIKPRIGAGSRNTIKVDDSSAGRAAALVFLTATAPAEGLMVQPFLTRIGEGEASLVYFDGVFSHAVLKRPRAGDFRSQPDFGAAVAPHVPTSEQRALADAVIDAVGGTTLLYARIDVVTGLDGRPCLIEAELCEPSLYLAFDAMAVDRFAAAIVGRIKPG